MLASVADLKEYVVCMSLRTPFFVLAKFEAYLHSHFISIA
jgi:hypothetical protein